MGFVKGVGRGEEGWNVGLGGVIWGWDVIGTGECGIKWGIAVENGE